MYKTLMKKCKNWKGYKDRKGYGITTIRIEGKSYCRKVHRLEWERHFGTIPSGAYICHHCDNPSCYLIEHLYLGDAVTNNGDRAIRGRVVYAKGSNHGLSKLTARQVQSIRRRLFLGDTKMSLAKKYGVSHAAIGRIANKTSWAWLDEPQDGE